MGFIALFRILTKRFFRKRGDIYIDVVPYAVGQFRIQIVRDGGGRFPDVLRELCTYDEETACRVVKELVRVDDPLRYAESLERPWNCRFPGDRIRLDNVAGDVEGFL